MSSCNSLVYTYLINILYVFFIVVDMIIGGFLIAFGFLLYDRLGLITIPFEISWLIWSYFIIGGIIIFEAFLSSIALISQSCRYASIIPKKLTIIVTIISFIIGVLIFIIQQFVFNFLNHHVLQYGLSSYDLEIIKNYYEISASCMMGIIPFLQGIKYYLNKSFLIIIVQSDGEFESLLDGNKKDFEDNINASKILRNVRYIDMREYYTSKYQNPSSSSSSSSCSVEGKSQSMYA